LVVNIENSKISVKIKCQNKKIMQEYVLFLRMFEMDCSVYNKFFNIERTVLLSKFSLSVLHNYLTVEQNNF